MKKFISLVLALLLLVGILPTAAFAKEDETLEEEILSETVTLSNLPMAVLSDQSFDLNGWPVVHAWCLGEGGFLQINKMNGSGYRLVQIEARVFMGRGTYENLKVNSGTIRESGSIKKGDILHVDDIEDVSLFQIDGKNGTYAEIDQVTVYYTMTCEHNWVEGVCTLCQRRCIHNWEKGICSICGYACKHKDLSYTGEYCPICNDILGDKFVNVTAPGMANSVDGRYFRLEGYDYEDNGWLLNSELGKNLKITAKEGNGLRIKRIEAKLLNITYDDYSSINISGGNKRETQAYAGDIIHIDDIHSTTFSMNITGSGINCEINDIAVYYECDHSDWQNGRCGHCNAECEHIWEDGKCTVCGMECSHQFVDERCTICGKFTDYEKIVFNRDNKMKAESESFLLRTNSNATAGWDIGNDDYSFIEISAKANSGKQIKNIQYSIAYDGEYFPGTVTTCGTIRETGPLSVGDIVHIDNVHSSKIKITKNSGNDYYVDSVTIFYEPVILTSSTFSEGNIWIVAAIGAVAVIGVAVLVVAKKKKEN